MYYHSSIKAGVTLQHLRDAGVTVSVLAAKQRAEGATVLQLAEAGFSLTEIHEAGCAVMTAAMRPGVGHSREDAISALVVILTDPNCDDNTLRMLLEADLLGGLKSLLHSSTNRPANECQNSQQERQEKAINSLKQKSAEMIPLLVQKGVSCPALLVHAGVLPPLLEMLKQPFEDGRSMCLAALALSSLAAAAARASAATDNAKHDHPSSPEEQESEGTGRGIFQETVRDRRKRDNEVLGEESVHELLLNAGVLQLLAEMGRHSMSHTRAIAVQALSTLLTSSQCANKNKVCGDASEGGNHIRHLCVLPAESCAGAGHVHRAQLACVRACYSSDKQLVTSLVTLLTGCTSQNYSSMEGGDVVGSLFDSIPSAVMNLMFILASHSTTKIFLSDTDAVRALLDLLIVQEGGAGKGISHDPSYDSVSDLWDKESLLSFSAQTVANRLIALLRLVSCSERVSLDRLVECGGLEVLTRYLGQQHGVLSERRSDILWTMHEVVSFAAPVLLAVGAIKVVLQRIVGERGVACPGGEMEAALSVLKEVLRVEGGRHQWRVLVLAEQLVSEPALCVSSSFPAPSLTTPSITTIANPPSARCEGQHNGALETRLHEVLRGGGSGESFREPPRSAARDILSTLDTLRK